MTASATTTPGRATIEASQGHAINYPLIGDPKLKVVKRYDMLPAGAGDTSGGRTPMDNPTARSPYIRIVPQPQ